MDEILEQLKAKKYRITTVRKTILEIFIEKENKHLLTEEIIDKVKKIDGNVNIASVYNTLNIFIKEKIINQYIFANKKYFELNKSIHGHFFCDRCESLINIDIPGLDCLDILIYKKYKAEIRDNKIEFYGICQECLENEKKEKNGN